MTFPVVCLLTLLRAVVVALLTLPLSRWQLAMLTGSRKWPATSTVIVFLPLLAPELITGYGYAGFELSLLHHPHLNQAFYTLLLVLKFAPAATLVRLCSPPPAVSGEAIWCDRLLDRLRASGRKQTTIGTSSRSRVIRWRGAVLPALPAVAIVVLLAFQEFELASLMAVPAWTVTLFDSQALGLDAAATLRHSALAGGMEMVVLGPLILAVRRAHVLAVPRWRIHRALPPGQLRLGRLVTCAGGMAIVVVPYTLIGASGLRGLPAIWSNRVLLTSTLMDIAASVVVAAIPTALALVAASWLVTHDTSTTVAASAGGIARKLRRIAFWITVAAGLSGSILVCILTVLAVQWGPLTGLRSSIIPACFALTVFLIPRAVLLLIVSRSQMRQENRHLASLLRATSDNGCRSRAAELIWRLSTRPAFWGGVLLFYWAMMNLAAATMLLPAGLSFGGTVLQTVPLPVRLYNLMHYGQNGPLSAMALACVLVPGIVVTGVAAIVRRRCHRL